MNCRHCGKELHHVFIDLFNSPPSNSFLTFDELSKPEVLYPLKILVCDNCFLVQIDEYKKSDEIFNSEYAYFSSYSTSWLKHSKEYVDMITERLQLNGNSLVIEIACNDGYLLQYFQEKAIRCLGIEPSLSTARVAREKGIQVMGCFFEANMASDLEKADLIIGNNVLAHVPDINNFVMGLKIALNQDGTITMEFPHLLNLIKYDQFDTIYHEHYSYFSLMTVQKIFESQGLKIYDVEELSTHGGSLRIYATHDANKISINSNVHNIVKKEIDMQLNMIEGYQGFDRRIQKLKWHFIDFLTQKKNESKKIVAYGAAAKGTTFLNYCGIRSDGIQFVVDASPYKQNKFMPLSHIPIVSEEILKKEKPDYIIVLPWNLINEISQQLSYTNEWDAKLVVAIPELKILGAK
jgi:SAM-dependent methyltransferase